jgi:nitrite reductase/ring-hydroxylating ferredoxin subunit
MAVTVEGGGVSQLLQDTIDRQGGWLDPLAEQLQSGLTKLLEQGGPTARRVKDALNGTWLGHPLHPILTDAAIGAWFTSSMLDLLGEESGADKSLLLGIACALPTAASGMADWHDQSDQPRRTGLVHALFNSTALVLFVGSALARRSRPRALGIGLSTTAMALATGGGYLGGELAYSLGTQVDRNAWDPKASDWQAAANVDDLVDGQLTPGEIEVDGKKLPLVLLKRGRRVLALGATCAHLGGPLAEGKLVGQQCVECPWHGSTFDLEDGHAVHGPSAYPQPAYATRQRNGKVEVRRKA